MRAICVVFLLLFSMATPVAAEQLDGALRVHTDLSLLSVIGSGGADAQARVGLGTALGFGLGYAATENILLGARLSVGHFDPVTNFALMPYFEVLTGPRAAVRAGLMVHGGMELLAANGDSTVFGVVGGGPVLHLFLGDTLFSFDPALLAQGLFGEGGSAWNIQLLLGFSGWPGARR